MKNTNSTEDLAPGTGITFKRGCLTYEGTIVSRSSTKDGKIVTYEVDVNACGGGPINEDRRHSIHDGQILRIYS